MNKEKFHIEFVLGNVSQNSLWRMISHVDGLSEWFADEVTADEENNKYIFIWSKSEETASIIGIKPMSSIRFHWDEDINDGSYFEFALHKLELSGGMALEVTDFAEPEDKGDAITLWESQIDLLKRRLGI